MEIGLLLIFWYGVLHAFGPDHLAAIADFSIGKSKRKTFAITFAFALGHGVMLFVFAKVLQNFDISDHLLSYGDTISAIVIFGMGIYILFMVFTNKIHLKVHKHSNEEHIHIWYGKEHKHNNNALVSALTIGALMGIGGARGVLVVFGVTDVHSVGFDIILMFILGVSVVFMFIGVVVLYINKNLLHNLTNVKRVFATVGVISVVVGTMSFFTPHSHALMIEPIIKELEDHKHPHATDIDFDNAEDLVASKDTADITYAQMMRQMGEALKMVQEGIITQNQLLVESGVYLIDSHPAPKEKPWMIMDPKDTESFKKSLISYDKLLHVATSEVLKSVNKKDWIDANEKLYNLSNHCISCHSVWKIKLKNKRK
ncbi:MAG: hypothetical protein U9R16_03030 [Campylobacterota bacterium]|nr:hypothetical protein [Campylobacterota bacterium]